MPLNTRKGINLHVIVIRVLSSNRGRQQLPDAFRKVAIMHLYATLMPCIIATLSQLILPKIPTGNQRKEVPLMMVQDRTSKG